MKNLKSKIQLKIKIPMQNNAEEAKTNLFTRNTNNNRNTITQITENIYISGYLIGKKYFIFKK